MLCWPTNGGSRSLTQASCLGKAGYKDPFGYFVALTPANITRAEAIAFSADDQILGRASFADLLRHSTRETFITTAK